MSNSNILLARVQSIQMGFRYNSKSWFCGFAPKYVKCSLPGIKQKTMILGKYVYHFPLTFIGPCHEKTRLRSFWPGHAQTSLLSYRDFSESCKIACCKLSFRTFLRMNNKGADQTALMRRLILAFVVRV